jgi:hypothetical protein
VLECLLGSYFITLFKIKLNKESENFNKLKFLHSQTSRREEEKTQKLTFS